ncbi:MAG: hypothetical protein V1704_04215 [Candidatus Vogelbacteria bacterium]
MNKVLIITSRIDLHADYLSKKLIEREIPMVRLNLDELSVNLSVRYTREEGHSVWLIDDGVKSCLFKPDQVTGVWYRRPFITRYDRTEQKASTAFVGRETEAYLNDVCVCLPDVKWINHPVRNQIAGNKLGQLRLARQLGFSIPETLVTNDAEEADGFIKRLAPKKVVYKTLSRPFVSETEETYRSVYTSLVEMSPQVARSIRLAPCLFQECVEKDYELRITVVGEQVFTTRLFSQEHTSTVIDWRRDQHKVKLRQELCVLDPEIEHLCVKLVKQLGLVFGAIDMIVTPRGEYVFLEINPNGQWLWMEVTLGAEISNALIHELTSS